MSVQSTPNNRKRIGVLMGGCSMEREVSIKSGNAVADALASLGHEVIRLELDSDFDRTIRLAKSSFGIDVAFIALHGTMGEDGCIQGMLECLQIPYTGSGVLASALAMDKLKSKELFRLHNVPTAPYYLVTANEVEDLEALHGSFGFPVFVKPRSEGSSIGVAKAYDLEQLRAAIDRALEYGPDVLVERFVKGKEIQVGLLGDRVLGAIEIEPKRDFYDFTAKYTPGMTEYHLPARISPTRLTNTLNIAHKAAKALGVTGACRVDLIVTEGENEYVLEVNTLPGMTPTSLLPKIAHAAGFDFATLCESIVEMATLHTFRQSAKPTLHAADHAHRSEGRVASMIIAKPKTRVAARG